MQGIVLHALVGLENEAFAVVALRVCNPDRSPFAIHD